MRFKASEGKGVAVTYRHNPVLDLLYRICKELGMEGKGSFPVWVPGAEGSWAGTLFREWPMGWREGPIRGCSTTSGVVYLGDCQIYEIILSILF
jgi:hypothetical protein